MVVTNMVLKFNNIDICEHFYDILDLLSADPCRMLSVNFNRLFWLLSA